MVKLPVDLEFVGLVEGERALTKRVQEPTNLTHRTHLLVVLIEDKVIAHETVFLVVLGVAPQNINEVTVLYVRHSCDHGRLGRVLTNLVEYELFLCQNVPFLLDVLEGYLYLFTIVVLPLLVDLDAAVLQEVEPRSQLALTHYDLIRVVLFVLDHDAQCI